MSNLPQPGAELGGKYRIIRLLGQGGMGAVYEAERTLTLKRVALKWLRPEVAHEEGSAARLVREALASARVRHPNVVDIYDVVEDEGAAFLVMEYLEGEPLTDALARGDLELHSMIALLIGAMRGVAAAHKFGVIHRDIKPDNIFLTRLPDTDVPVPKVLDFGIAKVDARGRQLTATRPVTLSGTTMGTPMYMSYEQLTREANIDGRADVYSFGVILYQALTGHAPYDATTLPELIVQIATVDPTLPEVHRPDIPTGLAQVVAHAMAKDREQRLPNLEAMVRALEPFATAAGLCSQTAEGTPNGPSQPPGAPASDVRTAAKVTPTKVDEASTTLVFSARATSDVARMRRAAFAQPGTPRAWEAEQPTSDGPTPEPDPMWSRSPRRLALVVVGVAAAVGAVGGLLVRTPRADRAPADATEVVDRAAASGAQQRLQPSEWVSAATKPLPSVQQPALATTRQVVERPPEQRTGAVGPEPARSTRSKPAPQASKRRRARRERATPNVAGEGRRARRLSPARARPQGGQAAPPKQAVPPQLEGDASEGGDATSVQAPRQPSEPATAAPKSKRRFRVALPTADQF
ncbi:MAG: protein kinase [Myxococcales bacterium]|nr:protein kinase [Myxococcales bacterium]